MSTVNRPAWTFEGYWNVVLGASRSAEDVVQDFKLEGDDGLDEWLGTAEADAWAMGGEQGDLPEEWGGYHARALDELRAEVQL